jgi:hypothetical protein
MCRMRTRIALAAVALGLLACSSSSGRDLARYYDPQGLFNASLPAANEITVTPPQPASSGVPGLLTGVIAAPPQPSPSPQTGGFGGGLNLGGQTAPTDQTTYEAFIVTTDTFNDIDAMSLYFLTGDPAVDVQHEETVRIAGSPGRLIVADVTQSGQVSASVAAAVSLGRRGDGYLVAAIFPPGGWDGERADFMRVLASFRAGVPPGFSTFPLTGGTG